MGFKRFRRRKNNDKIKNQSEIEKIKNKIEGEDRIFQQELQAKDKLLTNSN
jgi:hypothetical protein